VHWTFLSGSVIPVWTLWRLIGHLFVQTHGWCPSWWTSHRGGPSFRRLRAVWTIRRRLSSSLISQVTNLFLSFSFIRKSIVPSVFCDKGRLCANWQRVTFQVCTWRTLSVRIWATPASVFCRAKWMLRSWRRRRTTLCSLVRRWRYSSTLSSPVTFNCLTRTHKRIYHDAYMCVGNCRGLPQGVHSVWSTVLLYVYLREHHRGGATEELHQAAWPSRARSQRDR